MNSVICENLLPANELIEHGTTPSGWGVGQSPELLFMTTPCCGEPLDDGTNCFECGDYVLDRFPTAQLVTDYVSIEDNDVSTLTADVAAWTGYAQGDIHIEVSR